jgi:hypothetical protein
MGGDVVVLTYLAKDVVSTWQWPTVKFDEFLWWYPAIILISTIVTNRRSTCQPPLPM